MKILVDSCIILDILTQDPHWYQWSSATLTHYATTHAFIINAVIYSEISIRFSRLEDLEAAVPASQFSRAPIPWGAAFLAGKCFQQYKSRGGQKRSPLPDFFIGAHAQVDGMPLMTRDVTRYQTYFPGVTLIKP